MKNIQPSAVIRFDEVTAPLSHVIMTTMKHLLVSASKKERIPVNISPATPEKNTYPISPLCMLIMRISG